MRFWGKLRGPRFEAIGRACAASYRHLPKARLCCTETSFLLNLTIPNTINSWTEFSERITSADGNARSEVPVSRHTLSLR